MDIDRNGRVELPEYVEFVMQLVSAPWHPLGPPSCSSFACSITCVCAYLLHAHTRPLSAVLVLTYLLADPGTDGRRV